MKEREAIRKMLRENPEKAAMLRRMAEAGKIVSGDTPDPNEPLTIVCSTNNCDIDGSVQDLCAGCDVAVWVSPSTQAMIIERGHSPLRIICPVCWQKELLKNDEAH